jgi:predicted dehydrogenase
LAGVCDASQELLDKRRSEWGCDNVTTDFEKICADPSVDAVIIATPNFTHQPITLAAARHGKHVMCEKPLGLDAGEVRAMYQLPRCPSCI